MICFFLLSVADLLLTCWLLGGEGPFFEANPLAAWCLEQFGWAGLAGLKGLEELQYLEMNSSKVTGPGLAHLRGLQKLRYLGLGRTPLMDTGLVHQIKNGHLSPRPTNLSRPPPESRYSSLLFILGGGPQGHETLDSSA